MSNTQELRDQLKYLFLSPDPFDEVARTRAWQIILQDPQIRHSPDQDTSFEANYDLTEAAYLSQALEDPDSVVGWRRGVYVGPTEKALEDGTLLRNLGLSEEQVSLASDKSTSLASDISLRPVKTP